MVTKSIAQILIAIVIIVGLCVGGWFLYWKLYGSSVNREAKIRQTTYQRQNSLAEQVNKGAADVADIDVQLATTPAAADALHAQRKAIVSQTCSLAGEMTGSQLRQTLIDLETAQAQTTQTTQVDPTGVYSGQSTGTYVLCVDGNGKPYAYYWEGFVATLAGPARWDPVAKQAVLTGAPSAEFANGQK